MTDIRFGGDPIHESKVREEEIGQLESSSVKRKAKFREIARREGLTNEGLFIEFMSARFPNEDDDRYIAEWANRFKSGDPTSWMDTKSLSIYGNLLKKLRGVI